MKKKFSIFLLFTLGILLLYAQDTSNVVKLMTKAIRNNDYPRALQIYSIAQEEDYYDMESMDRLLCQVKYFQKDYKGAQELAQKLFDEDENDLITDLIEMIVWSQKKNNDSIIADRITEIIDNTIIPKNILKDLQKFPKEDLKNLNNAISRYILQNNISEKEDILPFNKLQTILYFCRQEYMECYNSGINLVSEDNPNVIYYILGYVRQKRKEYNSAIAFYNIAINQGYTSYDAYLNRAICKGSEAMYESSNLDLDTCLAIDTNYYALFLKGINYNYLQEYKTALYYLNLSLNLNDTFSPTYNYRGIIYANLKEYAFAALDFKLALEMNPKTAYAHNNLGISLEMTGKVEEAIKEYIISTKLEPRFFDAYYNLGRNYTYKREYKKAIKYLSKALELEQQTPDIYYLLGINNARLGKKKEACAFLHQALEMGHTEALEKITSYCEEENKTPENLFGGFEFTPSSSSIKSAPVDTEEDFPQDEDEE